MWLAPTKVRTRGDAIGWRTALQAGRSRVRFPMVSLTLSFLVPTKPRTEMSTRHISWVKGGRCLWLTFLSLSCADCLEPREPQFPGTIWVWIKSRGTSVNKSVVWTDCESLTISLHSSMLLIMHLRLRQGDSELNQKWFIHLGKRY